MSQMRSAGLAVPEGLTIEAIEMSDGLITVMRGLHCEHRPARDAARYRARFIADTSEPWLICRHMGRR